MRPVQLSLHGFASFREPATLDFGEADYFALVGPTGSGKSTVLDAIVFALYGTVPRWGRRDAIADALAPTTNRCTVSLVFDVAGERYQVAREVRRVGATPQQRNVSLVRFHDPTATAADVDTSEVLAGEIKELRECVESLLGLSYENFCQCVVLPQGQFARFLTAPAVDRQKILLALLGADQYEGIGRRAGARAEARRHTVDLLAGQVGELSDATTDEVKRLTGRRHDLEQVEAEVADRSPALTLARTGVAELEGQLGQSRAHLGLLDGLSIPDDVTGLHRRLRDAETARTRAEQQRRDASTQYQEAVRAGATEPSRDVVTRWRELYQERTRVEEELAAALEQVTAGDQSRTESSAALEVAKQQERSADEQLQLALEHQAESQQHQQSLQARHDDLQRVQRQLIHLDGQIETRAELDRDLTDHEQRLDEARTLAAAAAKQREQAEQQMDRARAQAEAAALRPHLEVGHACPVCTQQVTTLPPPIADPALDRARDDLERSSDDETRAREAANRADSDLRALQLRIQHLGDAIDSQWSRLRDDVADLPERPDRAADWLATRRHELDQQIEAAATAHRERTDAVTAARTAHHAADETLDRARTVDSEAGSSHARALAHHEALQKRFAGLNDSLTTAPPFADLDGLLARAVELATARDDAEVRVSAAEQAQQEAERELGEATEAIREARSVLHQQRDRVAVLGPPPLEVDDLPMAWHDLLAWAETQRSTVADLVATLADDLATAVAEADRLTAELRARVATVIEVEAIAADEDLARLLAVHTERARAEVARMQERLERRSHLEAEIATAKQEQQVAEELRKMLRSNRFPQWLADTALDSLVATASETLRRLSNDQFDLTHDKGEFAVVDHSDADSVRSVRTLSGGETFQASLALALALADQLAGMAGAVRLESMFLDEGFGTLDPESLDTVAATLENLASGDRTVGVVTHVQALAERVPVRFQVRRDSRTSSVTREAW